ESMPRIPVHRIAAILGLIFASMPAAAQQQDLLRAEEAFQFSVEHSEPDAVALRWQIADGYYLYRDHLEAKDGSTGEPVELQTQPGVVETADSNFGPSEVYYHETTALLADAPRQVTVTYQGCKKDSICYPPLTLAIDTESLQVSEPVIGFGAVTRSEERRVGTEWRYWWGL